MKRTTPLPKMLAGLTALLLLGLLAAAVIKRPAGEPDIARWQLSEPKVPVSDVPSGFEGLAFTGGSIFQAHAAFFRLTEDSDTDILYAYVPAEMGPEVSGPLHLRLRSGEQLVIEDADGAADSFQAGDLLPVFEDGAQYSFTILGEDEEALGTEDVIFYYTENVPSMYIETESGSMEAIDNDKHHETSEAASYRVYLTDGTPDSSGQCTIRGRGNSTWSQKKRPYNLKFEKENVILDMTSCRKYALIANFWDSTQTRQYYAFLTAERLGLAYTPQTQFVNLYLNGKYQSLYLLTQRINVNGGTVQITDLDKKNERANPGTDREDVETTVMETGKKDHEALACAWQKEPADLSGGYLIEFQNRYDKEDFWFSTETEHMSFKSPQYPSVGEYEYISNYVREAEAALYGNGRAEGSPENGSPGVSSGDSGQDPSSEGDSGSAASAKASSEDGSAVWDYFDMDSWARMYLIQDFFVQSDDEYYSFFFYKKANDPLLYCGPVWDFDLCLGNMNCGDYYKTSAQTLWLRDGRKKWLHQMDTYPEFRARVAQLYLEELEPIIRDLLENEYDQTVARLETDTKLNYLRWHKNLDYGERTGLVKTLLETRVQFLHDYYTDPDAFHRLLFHFAWDDFSYYVRDGESMGFLPTYDYGEKQSSYQREANGFITGWQDAATGELLSPDTPIYHDMEFDPVYIP